MVARRACFFAVWIVALPLAAQDSAKDLPAAPSATVQQKAQPAASPATSSASTPAGSNEPAAPADSPPAPGAPADTGGSAAANAPILENQPTEQPATTIRVPVNEVNLIFTATDKRGRLIKDLKRDDLKVIDDGHSDTQIRSFQRQTDLPLRLGMLVDVSSSVRDRFKFEQESAIEFLNQTLRRRYDKAFVVGFDATPEVTQDFTDNTESLSKGVRMLRPGGGTAMYDAIYFACRDKIAKEQQTGPIRHALIVLSDGDDNQSHVTREEAIEMALRSETIVYTISTNITGSRGNGDKILDRIAQATGGRSFFPFQITEVANAFSEIQDELRSQYALSYHPAEFAADGRYHTVEIVAQSRKNVRVRTRRGYYAPSR
jgi:VWFA-related protein